MQRYENALFNIDLLGDDLSFSKQETEDGAQTRYILRGFPTSNQLSVRFDSRYEMMYADLAKRGILHGPLASSSDCVHPAAVRLWTPSKGWTQLEVKCVE